MIQKPDAVELFCVLCLHFYVKLIFFICKILVPFVWLCFFSVSKCKNQVPSWGHLALNEKYCIWKLTRLQQELFSPGILCFGALSLLLIEPSSYSPRGAILELAAACYTSFFQVILIPAIFFNTFFLYHFQGDGENGNMSFWTRRNGKAFEVALSLLFKCNSFGGKVLVSVCIKMVLKIHADNIFCHTTVWGKKTKQATIKWGKVLYIYT